MTRQAKKLHGLLEAVKELELARLSVAVRKLRQMEAEVSTLRASRFSHQATGGFGEDLAPSLLTGVDLNWQKWVNAQIEVKNIKLAQHAAVLEDESLRARRALGRSGAFNSVMSKRIKSSNLHN